MIGIAAQAQIGDPGDCPAAAIVDQVHSGTHRYIAGDGALVGQDVIDIPQQDIALDLTDCLVDDLQIVVDRTQHDADRLTGIDEAARSEDRNVADDYAAGVIIDLVREDLHRHCRFAI